MDKSRKNNRRRLLLAIAIAAVIILAPLLLLFYTAIVADTKISTDIVPEYNALFNKDAQAKMELRVTATSRTWGITSAYVYDDNFYLFVFKAALPDDSSLKNIINFSNESSSLFSPGNLVFSGGEGQKYDMRFNEQKSAPPKSVTFRCKGDSIKPVVQNDSLYCYYFKFDNFSIRYNNGPYKIAAQANSKPVPGSLLFKKKGRSLYIILMTLESGNRQMPPDLLYSMTK